MPQFSAHIAATTRFQTDLLVVPVFEGNALGPGAREAARALELDGTALERAGCWGRSGEVAIVPGAGRMGATTVAFAGLGPKKSAGPGELRRAAMAAATRANRAASIATTLTQVGTRPAEAARAVAEGFVLARYRFDRYKSDPEPAVALEHVAALVKGSPAGVRTGLFRGGHHADAANWARDLVHAPSSDLTPEAIADTARGLESDRLTVKIWDERKLARGRFGALLGVGSGGANPPRLIELAYRGAGNAKPIALTGKGITFDAGGLSLKRAKDMEWMKADMAGAAAVLAVFRALPALSLRLNVIAAVPCAENMPGGSAIRPGDVLKTRGGRTIEIVDPDAEGRVVLSDALSYLTEQRPRAIVDVATLTGTGLGEDLWAVMGNDDRLVGALRRAGAEAGEPGWQLPLWDGYRRHTTSTIADINNGAWSGPDTINAGLMLSTFVGDIPWAHIDIGDTAFLLEERDGWPRGATGCPTRTLLRYLEREARAGR